ncbi:MAG: NUDIX hydrolase [Candidatus Binatia bacterium]
MAPAIPKKASTVILVRPRGGEKFDVLMTRRPQWMEFLAGHYVFPGGILEEEDWCAQMLAQCRGLTAPEAQAILGNALSPELALGHWITAIRELYEETGVLLGVSESGMPVETDHDGLKEKFEQIRKDLVQGKTSLHALLRSERLYCDASRLIYFARRITPEENPIRFDTRFYLGCLPLRQNPLPVSEEVDESVWVTPSEALKQCAGGQMPMIRPTRIILERLAEFDSWQSLSRNLVK